MLRVLFDFIKILFTPGKPIDDIIEEILVFLEQHGESRTLDIYDAFEFDLENIKPYTYVSLADLYFILSDLEEDGIVLCRSVYNGRYVEIYWKLTDWRRKKTTSSNLSSNLIPRGI